MATSIIPYRMPYVITDTQNAAEYTVDLPFLSNWNEYALVIGYRTAYYLFIDTNDVTTYTVNLGGDTVMTCEKLSTRRIKLTFSSTQWGGIRILYLG